MFIDTHLHLNRKEFSAQESEVINRSVAARVNRFMNVGYDIESSMYSVELAKTDSRFFASVGVHPHDALEIADSNGEITAQGKSNLQKLELLSENAVAIGEIGLDFFRDLSPRAAQRAAFEAQLELAAHLDLPVVLHIRDAYDEAIALIEKTGVPPKRGIMHAFAGDIVVAQWAVDNGFLLGIGGPVTYKNSNLFESVKLVGVDNIVLETDAPWLPPVPYRGKRNEPSYLINTAKHVAELLDISVSELAKKTTDNFLHLIGAGND